MTDQELHLALEAQGFVKEHTGGNCHAYRRGHIVITGADGDLPSLHWFTVSVWPDWHGSPESVFDLCDASAEYPDVPYVGEPRDIWADIATAEREALARAFVAQLQADISPDDLAAVKARNATDKYQWPVCASHDFCDANETMAAAFLQVMGRPILPEDDSGMTDSDCALWGDAWQKAKAEYLTD